MGNVRSIENRHTLKATNVITIAFTLCAVFVAQSAITPYYWDTNPSDPAGSYTGGNGIWSTNNNLWQNAGGSHVNWPAPGADNYAFFVSGAGQTINITNPITLAGISTIGTTGTAIFTNNFNSGTTPLSITLDAFSGNFYITNNQEIEFGGGGNGFIITGTANIVKWGTGTLLIQEDGGSSEVTNCTYIGNVYIHQGQFQMTQDNCLGNPTNCVFLDDGGGLNQNTGTKITLAGLRNIYIGPNGGRFPLFNNPNRDIIIPGSIEDWTSAPEWAGTPGTVTITGGAIAPLTLNGTNTFSGEFILGALSILSSGNAGGAGFTLNNSAVLTVTQTSPGYTMDAAFFTNAAASGQFVTNTLAMGTNALSETTPLMYVTNLSAGAAQCVINVTGSGFIAGQFPLIQYQSQDGTLGNNSFIAGSLPTGFVSASLSNNTANSSIDLVLTSTPLRWTAHVNNNWDTNTTNWINTATLAPSVFTTGSTVIFDDTASSSTVNITTMVSPGGVTVSNSVLPYVFQNGGGGISGSDGFSKLGSGPVTVQTINSYAGDTVIGNGAYVVGASGAIPFGSGAGNVQIGGMLDMNGFDTEINGWSSGSGVITNSAVSGTNVFYVNSGSNNITGRIQDNSSGAAISVCITNGASITLMTNQYYRGITDVAWGGLFFGAENVYPTNSVLNIGTPNHPAHMYLSGFDETIGGLTGTGVGQDFRFIANTTTNYPILTINVPTNTICVVSNVQGINPGNVNYNTNANNFSITKTGPGVQNISIAYYQGPTTVEGGTFVCYDTTNSYTQYLTNTVTVCAGAALAGNGRQIDGPTTTIQNGAKLWVGLDALGISGITTFKIRSSLILETNSTTYTYVDKDDATSDTVTGVNNITYGGALMVTNIGMTSLLGGEQYQLFSFSGTESGNFNSITILPATGLTGVFNPATGVLTINGTPIPTTPTNLLVSVNSGQINLSWPTNYLGWSLQMETNSLSVGLSTNWFTIPSSSLVTSTNYPLLNGGAVFFRMFYQP
jgi:hypothetical protein